MTPIPHKEKRKCSTSNPCNNHLAGIGSGCTPIGQAFSDSTTRPSQGAAEEEGDFQKQWDEIMHGTNPATIYGTRRLEWENVLEIGVFSGKFNALFSLLEKYTDALSRTRKEAEEKTWGAAVEAVPRKTGNSKRIGLRAEENKNGWNSARQQLINAAKEDGVEIEVCAK